ncbi:MAG: alpha/beta hydrolase [Mariprofundaceae bacterium]|nr:alpha/beta hydrolase [Mariprofundaceae bacterium]
MKFLLRLIVILLLAIGGSVAYMVGFENDYIYFPQRQLTQMPNDVGLSFRDVHFKSEDGITLHGWYMPHAHARFTLLHLHGNGGNMSNRLHQYQRWHALGLSVFAFDYRGYGNSEGTPSEAGLYADAKAAWLLLMQKRGLTPGKIIVAGRSLGCAVAAKLAAEVNPAGLALEVPFTSIPDMSQANYPWLPLRWFVKTRFDTEAAVRQSKVPLLLISAQSDEIIPKGMADRIFAAHNGPKLRGSLVGGHNDFESVSKHPYFRLWQRWLNSLKAIKSEPVQWVRQHSQIHT